MNKPEQFTGRTRLRPHREYGSDVLILQVEVFGGPPDEPAWRDAKIEDITLGNTAPNPPSFLWLDSPR